jgi:hypothetical protein
MPLFPWELLLLSAPYQIVMIPSKVERALHNSAGNLKVMHEAQSDNRTVEVKLHQTTDKAFKTLLPKIQV